ncbi:MAG: hypothetical protein ACQESK_04640 [Bacteroidota bacterium]
MEKFEDNIKEKLESRRLSPSDEAWLNINKKLEKKAKKKYRQKIIIMAVAASFVGILLSIGISTLGNHSATDSVVDSNKNEKPIQTEEFSVQKTNKRAVITPVNQLVFQPKKTPLNKPKITVDYKIYSTTHFKPAISSTEKTMAQQLLAEAEYEIKQDSLQMEVENLLAAAKSNVKKQAHKELIDSIDPASLLAEIDPESTLNLKEKIWQRLEENFKEIKLSLSSK